MNTTELATKLAASDLAAARKRGYMLVGQTTVGTVAVRHEAGVYTITTQGIDSKVLASGAPKTVRPVLASLYDIRVEG